MSVLSEKLCKVNLIANELELLFSSIERMSSRLHEVVDDGEDIAVGLECIAQIGVAKSAKLIELVNEADPQ